MKSSNLRRSDREINDCSRRLIRSSTASTLGSGEKTVLGTSAIASNDHHGLSSSETRHSLPNGPPVNRAAAYTPRYRAMLAVLSITGFSFPSREVRRVVTPGPCPEA